MATVTYTSTAIARAVREAIPGVNSVTVSYNSGTTSMTASAGANLILMAKLPNHCKVLDILAHHTSGADTCPTNYGISTDTDAFATAATTAAITRATALTVPFQVSLTDTANPSYAYATAEPTPGTSTASFKCNLTILYQPNSAADDI